MKTYNGNVEITKENEKEWAKKLEGVKIISGNLDIHSSASLTADSLESVGGDLSIISNASLPRLESVGGHLYIHSNASLPRLELVGGHLYIHSSASLTTDSLELVGGDLYIISNASLTAPKVKYNLGKGPVIKSFAKKGYLFADNILTKMVSKKKQGDIVVHKTKKIGTDKIVYVVQAGDKYSHGNTVKQAIKDLRYKIGSRDTSKYYKWTLDTTKPTAEIIEAYRVITGSCEQGTKSFCEGRKLPTRCSVKVAIRVTKGQFGNDVFAKFFERRKK